MSISRFVSILIAAIQEMCDREGVLEQDLQQQQFGPGSVGAEVTVLYDEAERWMSQDPKDSNDKKISPEMLVAEYLLQLAWKKEEHSEALNRSVSDEESHNTNSSSEESSLDSCQWIEDEPLRLVEFFKNASATSTPKQEDDGKEHCLF